MDTEDPRHVVTPFIVVYFSWVFHYRLVQVGMFTLHVTLTYLYYIELCMLYHPGRSVAMALACAQADWAVAKARGKVVGVMAFDLSTAFDTIDVVPLIEKLKSAGVGGTPLKWLESCMTGRSPLSHGVAQGSILGPLLFLVMVADIPKYVTSGTPKAKMMCYADDSTLYHSAESKELLKSDLELMSKKIFRYCNDNGLVINSAKTKLLLSSKVNFDMFVGDSIVSADPEISLTGINYNINFSTSP